MSQKPIDWDWIRAHYETGLSLRVIAKLYKKAKRRSISHVAIGKHARDEGWKVTAADEVTKRAHIVRNKNVNKSGSKPVQKLTQENALNLQFAREEAIEHGAARQAQVIEKHQRMLSQLNSQAGELVDWSDALIKELRHQKRLENLLRDKDVEDMKELRAQIGSELRVVSVLTSTIAAAAAVLSKSIPLEREAHAITGAFANQEDNVEQNMDLVLIAAQEFQTKNKEA